MALSENYLYLFGGQSENKEDYYDLWAFDFRKENIEKLQAKGPPGMKFSKCFTTNNQFNVLTGSKSNGASISEVWTYYPSEDKWTKLSSEKSLYDQSEAAIEKVSEYSFISLGGIYWTFTPKTSIFSFSNQKWEKEGSLDFYFFSGASSYFGNSIYIHGGGSSVRNIARNEMASPDFFKISNDSWKCSPGTYQQEGCTICPKGTYNDQFDQTACLKCPKGTSNSKLGAIDCLLCPQGTYMDLEGAFFCKDCTADQDCPLGTSDPMSIGEYEGTKTQQPSAYEPGKALQIYNFSTQIIAAVAFFAVFFVLTRFQRIRDYVTTFDLYKAMHKHQLNKPMIFKTTFIGGLFSVLFYVLAILLCLNSLLIFYYENVEEYKSLVPLVTVDNTYDFQSLVVVKASFYNYPGNCQANKDLELELRNLVFSDTTTYANKTQENKCVVVWECRSCGINQGSFLYLKLGEFNSFTTRIEVQVQAESSIPDQLSSTSTVLNPISGNEVFQGGTASDVTFRMTPSIFKSQVTSEETTGYHVTLDDNLQLGSTNDYLSLSISTTVKLNVNFELENVALMTQRNYKQSYTLLLSGLLGSIFGLMGMVGKVMKFVEKNTGKLKNKLEYKKKMKEIHLKNASIKRNIQDFYGEENLDLEISFAKPRKSVKICQISTECAEPPKSPLESDRCLPLN